MSRDASTTRKLGTFGGVFVPNVLTILGVIMFMRTGWVVGNAGLMGALLILLIAKAITILTTLSLSSISTNSKVGAGGAYFLISRSLGLEVGGSIGIPLYFAQAISVAFYLVGFSESLKILAPGINEQLISMIALALFVGVAWFGASVVAKTQYLILILLVASLVSIFTGFGPAPDFSSRLGAGFSENQGFWTAFAIFFPAVTGIMAGVSMSGDLKNPSKSIPAGTIWAVVVTMVIYAILMVWLALNADREQLQTDNLVLLDIASVPVLIYLGLWAATLSSALASLAAAPRTLKALAQDRVLPRVLGNSLGRGSLEPHVSLLITAVVAGVCILLGDLDLIAPVISMFFLATYGTVNLVAGIERIIQNPSYRPSFKTHWALSILGGLGCVGVMLLINPIATVVAMVIIMFVYGVLSKRAITAGWGDARSGIWFAITRFGLLRYGASRQHLRNWRPIILVLVGSPKSRLSMLMFAHAFEARRGFLFLGQIVTGAWDELVARHSKLQAALRSFITDNRLSAVPKTIIAENFEHGVASLLQITGIGDFQPNTVMIGWSDDLQKRAGFANAIRRILALERNLLVFADADEDSRADLIPRIDVWWYARENGSFMATMAYLLRSNPEWANHPVRVLRIIQDAAGTEDATTGTQDLLTELRVEARVEVIVSKAPPIEVIAETSRRSAVCFVGLAISAKNEEENPLDTYADLVAALEGNVFLTKSWHDLKL